jgi:hypothetical protein
LFIGGADNEHALLIIAVKQHFAERIACRFRPGEELQRDDRIVGVANSARKPSTEVVLVPIASD